MIEEILQKHNVEYTISGQDFLVRCLNPEHTDSNPSMRINRESGVFHCFACKFKGNILVHFGEPPDKIALLRARVKKKVESKKKEMAEAPQLSNITPYIGSWRNISAKTMRKFEPFYSPDMPDRLIFPIYAPTGKKVAYIGRSTNSTLEPKYKITPSGISLPLFPVANPIRGRVLLVEGIVDAMNLWDKGLCNVSAVFGARVLTDAEIELLSFQAHRSIDILYDNDAAGQKAAFELEEKLKKAGVGYTRLTINNVNLKDPGDFGVKEVEELKKLFYA